MGRRIASPALKRVQTVLTCGLTPEKLALTLCIGTALGIMPLLWGTTFICIILAHLFKLNHVALQSINYLLYPLQLALLLPFFKMGELLFPWGPCLPQQKFSVLISNFGLDSVRMLACIALKSIAAWMITALPAALLAYGILMMVAARNKSRTSAP